MMLPADAEWDRTEDPEEVAKKDRERLLEEARTKKVLAERAARAAAAAKAAAAPKFWEKK